MSQGISEVAPKELTAREIFNRIVKGQVVRIGNDPTIAAQLKNHLNVIKSREKKLFESLQLDFISSVISVEVVYRQLQLRNPTTQLVEYGTKIPDGFEIKLVAPKKRKKFAVFALKKEESVGEPSPI